MAQDPPETNAARGCKDVLGARHCCQNRWSTALLTPQRSVSGVIVSSQQTESRFHGVDQCDPAASALPPRSCPHNWYGGAAMRWEIALATAFRGLRTRETAVQPRVYWSPAPDRVAPDE